MTQFILPPWANHSFMMHSETARPPTIVTLSVEKIENAWKRKGPFEGYVGAKGLGGKPLKYERVRDWLASNETVYMPLLELRTDRPEAFCFNDGRHTFAFFRDSGCSTLEFGVPLDKKDLFVATYGPVA